MQTTTGPPGAGSPRTRSRQNKAPSVLNGKLRQILAPIRQSHPLPYPPRNAPHPRCAPPRSAHPAGTLPVPTHRTTTQTLPTPIHSSRISIAGSIASARCAGIHVATSPSNAGEFVAEPDSSRRALRSLDSRSSPSPTAGIIQLNARLSRQMERLNPRNNVGQKVAHRVNDHYDGKILRPHPQNAKQP
jgi:hypothetical protein